MLSRRSEKRTASKCITACKTAGADALIGPLFYDNMRNSTDRSGNRPLRFGFRMRFETGPFLSYYPASIRRPGMLARRFQSLGQASSSGGSIKKELRILFRCRLSFLCLGLCRREYGASFLCSCSRGGYIVAQQMVPCTQLGYYFWRHRL